MKKLIIFTITLLLYGCNSCYDTEEEAWDACNSKYNGKCRYLGKSYKVCRNPNE